MSKIMLAWQRLWCLNSGYLVLSCVCLCQFIGGTVETFQNKASTAWSGFRFHDSGNKTFIYLFFQFFQKVHIRSETAVFFHCIKARGMRMKNKSSLYLTYFVAQHTIWYAQLIVLHCKCIRIQYSSNSNSLAIGLPPTSTISNQIKCIYIALCTIAHIHLIWHGH
jgi:predicted small integral membrane protein